MKQPKLYYFMNNSHHYLISRIDKDKYGIFDLCTIRYSDERFDTLEKAIDFAKGRNYGIQIFDTYRDMFKYMIVNERDYDTIDFFEEKDLIERESLATPEKAKEVRKKMGWDK